MTINVLISILNWNGTTATLDCINDLVSDIPAPGIFCKIRIIDNNSDSLEKELLRSKLPTSIEVFYNNTNLGFAGGQNQNIQYAIENNYDYVWLLNNDTRIPLGTVGKIIQALEAAPEAGAASPVITRMGSPDIIDFAGATHDWQHLDSIRCLNLSEAPIFNQKYKNELWAVGTALMLRTKAVQEVGLLDDQLFAYYEDDDYGTRLNYHGWQTTMVLNSHIEHACFDGEKHQRAPYFFYLMNRNAVLFLMKHTPKESRQLLKLRLIEKTLFSAEKLYDMGYQSKGDACLLGLSDGLQGVGGPPRLDRAVPFWLRALRPVSRWWNRKHRSRVALA